MKPDNGHLQMQQPQHGGSSRWLTTFNDMITLLMVFFVLLFSMGSMDVKRFKNFQNALQSAMGVLYEGRHAPVGVISDQQAEMTPIDAEKAKLEGLGRTPGLEAEYTNRGIQLILDDKLLFDSGSAALTTSGLRLLDKVAKVIRPLERYVRVEGHTDSDPIVSRRFPSNWELSTGRAVQVVKYLAQFGGMAPQHLSAAGYGDTRPRGPNDSAENKSRNRRVEIILGQPVTTLENKEEWRN